MTHPLTKAAGKVVSALDGLPPDDARYLLRFVAARVDRPAEIAAGLDRDLADRAEALEQSRLAAKRGVAELMAHYNVADLAALAARLAAEGGVLVAPGSAAGATATTEVTTNA